MADPTNLRGGRYKGARDRLTVRMPVELHERLLDEAKARGLTVNDVIVDKLWSFCANAPRTL